MKISSSNKVRENPYSGLFSILIFICWILLSEYGPTYFEPDLGSFIWTTFHFIFNPILSIAIVGFLIWHLTGQSKMSAKLLSVALIIFPVFICYVGVSGNIWFVELLGINFN
jgi:hypothetical protein